MFYYSFVFCSYKYIFICIDRIDSELIVSDDEYAICTVTNIVWTAEGRKNFAEAKNVLPFTIISWKKTINIAI